MQSLAFSWPYWPVFWAVFIWAFTPEFRIVLRARTGASRVDSPDAGSLRVILIGMWIATGSAFPLSNVTAARFPNHLQLAVFFAGLLVLIAGSLLRRHCWRLLGPSFTGDIRASTNQVIVSTGAYRLLRHPSYTGGLLMNLGLGLGLGSWGSVLLLGIASFAVYGYRIHVEERVLLAVVGEPYRTFIRSRWRMIPFVW